MVELIRRVIPRECVPLPFVVAAADEDLPRLTRALTSLSPSSASSAATSSSFVRWTPSSTSCTRSPARAAPSSRSPSLRSSATTSRPSPPPAAHPPAQRLTACLPLFSFQLHHHTVPVRARRRLVAHGRQPRPPDRGRAARRRRRPAGGRVQAGVVRPRPAHRLQGVRPGDVQGRAHLLHVAQVRLAAVRLLARALRPPLPRERHRARDRQARHARLVLLADHGHRLQRRRAPRRRHRPAPRQPRPDADAIPPVRRACAPDRLGPARLHRPDRPQPVGLRLEDRASPLCSSPSLARIRR